MPYITSCPGQRSGFCLLGTLDPPHARSWLGTRPGARSAPARHCQRGATQPGGFLPPRFTYAKSPCQGMRPDVIPRPPSKPSWSSASRVQSMVPLAFQAAQRGSLTVTRMSTSRPTETRKLGAPGGQGPAFSRSAKQPPPLALMSTVMEGEEEEGGRKEAACGWSGSVCPSECFLGVRPGIQACGPHWEACQ